MPKNMIDENKEIQSKMLDNYSYAASYKVPLPKGSFMGKKIADDYEENQDPD